MKVYIAKIDYFDPDKWPVLAAPYAGRNPETSRTNITDVATKLGKDGIAILVGSSSQRVPFRLKRRLLGAVSCHMALYETKAVVDGSLYASAHFTRADGAFRMPFCIPYSSIAVCCKPYQHARNACGDELVDDDNKRQWLIRLSDTQAKRALEALERYSAGWSRKPRPDNGFITDL